jgi:predicted nuclease of predicted toxin-antitoxin system
MPSKYKSLDEWEREQRKLDPNWDRSVRAFQKMRGPKRKVPLLIDENIEAELIAELQAVKDFRVSVGRPRASDKQLWNEARHTRAILVTADMDFWDDRKFPLAQSPGVIIVSGRSADDKLYSLTLAMVEWDIVENWRRVPFFLDGSKLKSSREEVNGKHWDGTSVVLS